ncbi:carboxypeptidase-like regulatory domain-containing protein [Pedobacter boryungensis]|uniref:Carboxypeptidase-like regulatory domain-containing protein n=1 Tax=Pedobacter boryungensis TaxID=869962 RepID=A0ABX2DBC7_9SPHI|nr:carboxypeptidase-like regulatory domain-containing protein [Pedobacter boryungensis]NQX31349.1 carboxypeptidase-like regulatory domain-containing protein [Pedobacter boryungensis]
MKSFFILTLLLFSNQVFAQNVNGYVIDDITKLPIENVQVITENSTTFTSATGKFNLGILKNGAKISFRNVGYETYEVSITKEMLKDTLRISLKSSPINLNAVIIKGARNYKLDSLNLRKEYAKVFDYKAPRISDIFIQKSPSYKSPFANTNPNSTASIISLNVLQVFNLLGKNKTPVSKLKQTLLKDEDMNYVDHVFSKGKVELITHLKADSLQNFMQRYRPTIQEAKRLNEYEMILYIKKSYSEFIK